MLMPYLPKGKPMDAEKLYVTLHDRLDALLQTAHLTRLEHRALHSAVDLAYEHNTTELERLIKEESHEG